MAIMQEIETKLQKGISVSTDEEVYYALLELVKDKAEKKVSNKGKKKLYYISAEFLIGKLLSNNLINLGIYDEVKETLEKNGKSLAEIEEIELEPSLGNGGLGRLAACFIDSIATLGLNGDGVGLNYHYGLFKQVFENNLQKETPNPWITKESWLTKTDITYPVSFGGFTVQSRLYDIDVVGYNNRTTKLHLFDIESRMISRRTLHYSYILMIQMIRDVFFVYTSSISWYQTQQDLSLQRQRQRALIYMTLLIMQQFRLTIHIHQWLFQSLSVSFRRRAS